MKNFSELKKVIKKKGVEYLDFKYTDLLGKMRHLTLPVSRFSKELFEKGEAFDASSTSGMKSVHSGDMVMIPDISTAKIDPFWEKPTMSFLCSIADAETKEFFHLDPRGVAFNAYNYLSELKIADEGLFAPEFEFYLFNKLEYKNTDNTAYYYLESDEANLSKFHNHDQNEVNNATKIQKKDGYHANPTLDLYYEARNEIISLIEKYGYSVRYHHH